MAINICQSVNKAPRVPLCITGRQGTKLSVFLVKNYEKTISKPALHPRNRYQGQYDIGQLCSINPQLQKWVTTTPAGTTSVNFSEPDAVRALNQALLKQYYNLNWQLAEGFCARRCQEGPTIFIISQICWLQTGRAVFRQRWMFWILGVVQTVFTH